jgi:hypothetical protein
VVAVESDEDEEEEQRAQEDEEEEERRFPVRSSPPPQRFPLPGVEPEDEVMPVPIPTVSFSILYLVFF